MDIGVFIPIGNNGWLISEAAPQYMPSFELNKQIVQKAEKYGLEFALSMIKLRGFGGKTEFWDYNLESFTLMASLAAVTERIKLFASTAVLTLPPAIVARMATTIDNVAPGRFGVNIVSGWQMAEYDQMGIWPGNDYFGYRYDYSSEYVHVMKELWSKGECTFEGKHFQMSDCKMKPMPANKIEIVAAGQSPRGMEFAAEYADYNFVMGAGINTPTAHKEGNVRLVEASAKTGRDVGAYVLFMVIADETDELAKAKWENTAPAPMSMHSPGWPIRAARTPRPTVPRPPSTSTCRKARSTSTWARSSAPMPPSRACWTKPPAFRARRGSC